MERTDSQHRMVFWEQLVNHVAEELRKNADDPLSMNSDQVSARWSWVLGVMVMGGGHGETDIRVRVDFM